MARLLGQGLNDCQVSRLTSIPRGTIRDWRHKGPPGEKLAQKGLGQNDPDCPTCRGAKLDGPAYAYLLGLYLGDGCIAEAARRVFRIRITLDERYPLAILEGALAMSAARPSGRMSVIFVQKKGCVEISANWKHWPCLFPQHGPGRKHERRIVLEPWQEEIARDYPDRLLRGLIQSDGSRFLNRVKSKGYPRYMFTNRSDDIRAIFCRACDDFGVSWRPTKPTTISIARAPDVRKLDAVVGPKR